MRLLVHIWVIASILMLPLHTAALLPSGGCGLPSPALQSPADSGDDCCAGQPDAKGDETPGKDSPRKSKCNGCNCPLRCCTGVNTVSLLQLTGGLVAQTAPIVSRREIAVESCTLLPHLSGLKRPPKPTTSAQC